MAKNSYKENGRPADQWYWDDWFSAFDVRLCSLAARGLWIDMLGIMFKAEIRGTLTINGKQVDNKRLAKIAGDTIANIKKYKQELEDQDVFSYLEDKTIICRRMFRKSGKQDQISQIRAEAGKKGAEARWQTDGKPMAKMAASSSSPSSSSTSTPSSKDTRGQEELNLLFEKWWDRYPKKEDKGKGKEKWLTLVVGKKVDPQEIEDALTGYINILNNEQTPVKFIKQAKTFLFNGNEKKKIESTWRPYIKYSDPKYKSKAPL